MGQPHVLEHQAGDSSVADVVLERQRAGGVPDELVGIGVEGDRREQALHVDAVAGLAHREAPLQLAPDDARHARVVTSGADQRHC